MWRRVAGEAAGTWWRGRARDGAGLSSRPCAPVPMLWPGGQEGLPAAEKTGLEAGQMWQAGRQEENSCQGGHKEDVCPCGVPNASGPSG